MSGKLEARVINWKDYQTERDIEGLEYKGLKGKAALDEAYTRIYARYENPKNEEDINGSFLFRDQLQEMMRMYFTMHPETAREIVDSYDQKYQGARRIGMWWEFFWSPIKGDRYDIAKERVALENKK